MAHLTQKLGLSRCPLVLKDEKWTIGTTQHQHELLAKGKVISLCQGHIPSHKEKTMQQRLQAEWVSTTVHLTLWENCTSQTKRGQRQNATSKAEAVQARHRLFPHEGRRGHLISFGTRTTVAAGFKCRKYQEDTAGSSRTEGSEVTNSKPTLCLLETNAQTWPGLMCQEN